MNLIFGSQLGAVAQQIDTAAAGNGGGANAGANGGAAAAGDFNTGGNHGQTIGVGDSVGLVEVDGGSMAGSTEAGIDMSAGTALSAARGGDYNLAFVS
ncbi:MAG: hypothetical protein ACKOWF_19470 [Chloroflexota bacterium]